MKLLRWLALIALWAFISWMAAIGCISVTRRVATPITSHSELTQYNVAFDKAIQTQKEFNKDLRNLSEAAAKLMEAYRQMGIDPEWRAE